MTCDESHDGWRGHGFGYIACACLLVREKQSNRETGSKAQSQRDLRGKSEKCGECKKQKHTCRV